MTEKATHSPEPWVMDEKTCDEVGEGEIAVRAADNSIVAGVWPHGGDSFGSEVQLLNGQLIQDAPRMRRALEDATRWNKPDRADLELYLFNGVITLRIGYQDRPTMLFKFKDAAEARLIATALIKKAEELEAGQQIG